MLTTITNLLIIINRKYNWTLTRPCQLVRSASRNKYLQKKKRKEKKNVIQIDYIAF